MDAAGAVPILAQVMQKRDDCSAQLRKRAVFLLSQKATGEAVALLIRAANDDPAREVRSDAVFWLGQTRSEQATGALEQIALRSPDMALRDKAIFALAQQGSARGAALLRQIAEGDDTPRRLREQAIFQLGQRGSQANAEYLRDLFAKLPRGEEALKKNVLFSLSQMRGFGNDRWLLTVGLDEAQTVDVRKHAFFTAGQNGVGGSALATIYDQVRTPEIKEQLIWVMSQSSDRAGADKLVQIAKTDPNREMRKKALFWLGQMNDPRIKQIIADLILNG